MKKMTSFSVNYVFILYKYNSCWHVTYACQYTTKIWIFVNIPHDNNYMQNLFIWIPLSSRHPDVNMPFCYANKIMNQMCNRVWTDLCLIKLCIPDKIHIFRVYENKTTQTIYFHTPSWNQRDCRNRNPVFVWPEVVELKVAYFCLHLSDNYVDLLDNHIDLSDLYVDLSDHYFDLSENYHHN